MAWSLAFIARTSIVGLDGHRYFVLFDDAMVSMRYGWNLSHGNGLTWNPGERVEGYTNLLQTLVMAGLTLIFDKSTACLAVQVLGIVWPLGTAALAGSLATESSLLRKPTEGSPWPSVLAFGAVLAYYPLSYWSLMGMETGLVAFLITASAVCGLVYVRSGSRRALVGLSTAACLSYLARPDALILVAVLLLGLAAIHRLRRNRESGRRWSGLALAALAVALVVLGQEAFRWAYYRALVPNTYTLKMTGMPLTLRLLDGWRYLRPFLQEHAFLGILSAAGLLGGVRPARALILAIAGASLTYQVWTGGDAWPYWRLVTPALPGLISLAVVSAQDVAWAFLSLPSALGEGRTRAAVPLRLLRVAWPVVLVAVAIGRPLRRFDLEILFRAPPYSVVDNQGKLDTALALDRLTTPEATLAVTWAGTIPYYTGRRSIDILGKSDPVIAHLPADVSGAVSWNGLISVPGHNKYDLTYSLQHFMPTYVQVASWGRQDLSGWVAEHYDAVLYHGVGLYLLKGSPDVRWEALSPP